MLALMVAVALSQCTKDTDCKGDRLCSAGACVDAPFAPPPPPILVPASAPTPLEVREPARNPYRVHRIVATTLGPVLWGATVVGSVAIGDEFWGTTFIPVVGPLVTYLRVIGTPGAYFLGEWAPILLWTSTLLQAGALAYLIAAIIREANFDG